jgi:hypothetical protein
MKNPVKMLADLTSRLAGARSALDAVHETDKALRTMHAELQAERARLCGAKPPREAVIAAAERQVDAIAAAWAAANGAQLVTAIVGAVDVQPNGEVRGLVAGNLLHLPALAGLVDVPTLAAIMPEYLKDGLRRVIEATPYVAGPPMADRPGLIADVDAKIADVEDQHSELVARAAELGISIELLLDVRARRAHEANLAEFRERDARDRARRVRN